MTTNDCRHLVEQAAEQMVMLDPNDLQHIGALYERLDAIAGALDRGGWDGDPKRVAACAAAARSAALLVEGILLEKSANRLADLATVGKAITVLQTIVCLGKTAAFPPELGVPAVSPEANAAPSPAPVPAAPPSPAPAPAQAVPAPAAAPTQREDDETLKAFVEQEESVFAEIDEHLLAFEKTADPQRISALKRLLHTMKSEAAVLGLPAVEAFCHKLEDYFEKGADRISTDVLFGAKDWLAQAIRASGRGEPAPDPKEILARMESGAKASPAPATVSKGAPPAAPAPAPATPKPAAAPETATETGSADGIAITDVDLTQNFIVEAREHFENSDANLLILEKEPRNAEAIAAVFRAFHTIKGVSGFLGIIPIMNLAHKAETLLDEVRNGQRGFAGRVVDVTFSSLDMLKLMVNDLAAAVASGKKFYPHKDLPKAMRDLVAVLEGKEPSDGEKRETAEPAPAPKAEGGQPEAAEGQKAAADAGGTVQQPIKIDAQRLDLLLDTIGELVIAESIMSQDRELQSLKSQRIEKNLAHMGKITRVLQNMGMGMRMIPIDATFRKMARLVRDLAKKAGKKIELITVGSETELDRGMVEKLGDPLVHMIRNSVDHGIEATSDDRARAGKTPAGHITLKAYHKGGNINIEIADDGRGLDREAIVNKGIERGLITDASKMSDQEVFSLIFQAGFSTAKVITEISGRGVGMDVVRRNIEALRGRILIDSQKGRGTTFTLVLPLTMAIIDGMVVRVGREFYTIPLLSIVALVRPSRGEISTVTGKSEILSFRGNLVPLFRASDLFGIQAESVDLSQSIVVVVEDGGRQVAIVVDDVVGQQTTVIKSLSEKLGSVTWASGACIMADGTPGFIVDVAGLVALGTSGDFRRLSVSARDDASPQISGNGHENAAIQKVCEEALPSGAEIFPTNGGGRLAMRNSQSEGNGEGSHACVAELEEVAMADDR
jgi:two-component system chemotaxis sensor kinase CheA